MDTRVRAKRWSRLEYERLVHLGVFRPGERLELVGGALLVREPLGSPHATAIQAVQEALRGALGPGWLIRTQMPVALDDESEPEPDVSVVAGSFRDYSHAHPSRPALLVEVAESSLDFDRKDKGSPYARAAYGWAYLHAVRLGAEDHVAPPVAPTSRIRVSDLHLASLVPVGCYT